MSRCEFDANRSEDEDANRSEDEDEDEDADAGTHLCLYYIIPCRTSWWLNHPSEKYARQIGSFPQLGMNIKKYLSSHQPGELVDNIQDVLGTLTQSNAYDFLHGITSNYTNHWDFDTNHWDFDTNHWDFDFVLVKMT